MEILRRLCARAFPVQHPLTPALSTMRRNGVTKSTGWVQFADGSIYHFIIEKKDNK